MNTDGLDVSAQSTPPREARHQRELERGHDCLIRVGDDYELLSRVSIDQLESIHVWRNVSSVAITAELVSGDKFDNRLDIRGHGTADCQTLAIDLNLS